MKFKCVSSRARRVEIVISPGDEFEVSFGRTIAMMHGSPYFAPVEDKKPVKKAAKKKAEVKDGSNSTGDGE